MENEPKEKQTYLCLGNPNAGSVLEFDMVTYRAKGQEERYLSVLFSEGENEPINMTLNEDSFKAIKDFFAQLEWLV